MTMIKIPDFISQCPFPLSSHPHGDIISTESDNWYREGFDHFTDVQERHLSVLVAGKLSAYVYSDSDDKHLRASCDLMNLIFHYGDLTDDMDTQNSEAAADLMMNALWFPEAFYSPHCGETSTIQREPTVARLPRDFWKRCINDAGPNFQARFLENIGLFLQARNAQSVHRQNAIVPSLEEYIDIRRNSSGLKPLIDFLEYTLEIDLPNEVADHPVMRSLKECVNDFCTWSNDIFSFNKEQASGDTYNMVIILMKTQGLDLQSAVDYVGDMCFKSMHSFCEYERQLPSWGPRIDKDVSRYTKGLQNWLIACLHWSYLSGRYFGKRGPEIKRTLIVELLPPKVVARDS